MSHRRLRAARSLIAVTALIGAALIAPQMASADPPPPPTAAVVTAQTDPAVAASLGDVPAQALPSVLAAVGTPFTITVAITDGTGPSYYEYDATVTLTADGLGVLGVTSAVLPAGESSIQISTSYSKAVAALTVTATVTPTQPPVIDPYDPPTVLPPLVGSAPAFPVELQLTLVDGADVSLRDGTAGADGAGCAVVDAQHPMCGIVTLPRGAEGGTALTLGSCPAGQTCTPGALVTQFLGDLTSADGDLYTRTAPATMTILCDKTLCGKGGVAHYRALWSDSATDPLQMAPACPAKGVIGADQDFCTDHRASSRMKGGDLRLVVRFLTDVRGMI
ncbi:hypothetical protein [Microbacterium sp. H1-D42]|uniref:hypothetical protein n=1 Tax=Microbacterium sp. H1-D42 TaxID=2925844 RepID=UPI001F52FE78|nr:hypothetical protein [Microbacterium sp. H1-D42]UNK71484.1 hypothetical protein MNR00_03240 [Microbacterium sp. H1-D42]